MESRFKIYLNLQIILPFLETDRFSDSVHKSFYNLTTLSLGKKKWGFLNQNLPVRHKILSFSDIPSVFLVLQMHWDLFATADVAADFLN